ncbi:MAG TPA: helix-turn-helix domain-containing protein [Pyrinomonadaceae bacterium]|nr:helix-turn-helix domain-containing protein [Pyrinomonadaceae bacterium]
MPVTKSRSAVEIKSIAQKLEAINRIAGVVLKEVETFTARNFSGSENINYYEEIERFEIELLLFALYRANGNQRRAARILNINPTTLNSKVRKFNLIFPSVTSEEDGD